MDEEPDVIRSLMQKAVEDRSDAAWSALLEVAEPIIRSGAGAHLSGVQLEDAVQEASIDLHRALAGEKTAAIRYPVAWLRVLGRNAAINLVASERSRRQREREVAAATLAQQTVGEVGEDELRAAVTTMLALLDERHRQLIELRYLRGWGVGRIAEHLSESQSAIKSALHRALKGLRRQLAGAGMVVSIAGLQQILGAVGSELRGHGLAAAEMPSPPATLTSATMSSGPVVAGTTSALVWAGGFIALVVSALFGTWLIGWWPAASSPPPERHQALARAEDPPVALPLVWYQGNGAYPADLQGGSLVTSPSKENGARSIYALGGGGLWEFGAESSGRVDSVKGFDQLAGVTRLRLPGPGPVHGRLDGVVWSASGPLAAIFDSNARRIMVVEGQLQISAEGDVQVVDGVPPVVEIDTMAWGYDLANQQRWLRHGQLRLAVSPLSLAAVRQRGRPEHWGQLFLDHAFDVTIRPVSLRLRATGTVGTSDLLLRFGNPRAEQSQAMRFHLGVGGDDFTGQPAAPGTPFRLWVTITCRADGVAIRLGQGATPVIQRYSQVVDRRRLHLGFGIYALSVNPDLVIDQVDIWR